MKCPICACDENVLFYNKNENSLMICKECRHIFWNIMPKENELDKYYTAIYTNAHGQRNIQQDAKKYYQNHVQELLCFVKNQTN